MLRLGTDPEAFFKHKNQIIGSEKLIPAKGISTPYGRIVRDGVQFELNPRSGTSVDELGHNISGLFVELRRILSDHKGVSICLDGLVEVSRAELDSLSPECQVLGCKPSFNIYDTPAINVDPVLYQKRSAGGHIHVGVSNRKVLDIIRHCIATMDIVVGNSCVLLDRDLGAAERRENYGRAGEFRLPNYGFEYRTTSNFWIHSFTLMSFVFGLAQFAESIVSEVADGNKELWNDLANKVDIEKVKTAINTNNFSLALANFERIIPFLERHLPSDGVSLTPNNLRSFIRFAKSVNKHNGVAGMYPPTQVIRNWTSKRYITFSELLRG